MKLKVTVEGICYEVDVEILEDEGGRAPIGVGRTATAPNPAAAPLASPRPAAPAQVAAANGSNRFPSPIAGAVRSIKVKPGDAVVLNQPLMVLEAMKMETTVSSSMAGTVRSILVSVGDNVAAGQALVEFVST